MQELKNFPLTAVKYSVIKFGRRLQYNVAASIEYPLNFIMQCLGMIINNISFIFAWYFVFHRFPIIRGYELNDIIGLYAVSMSAFGLTFFVFGSISQLSELLFRGQIDSYILLPSNTLLNILMSSSEVTALGDIICGITLFFFVAPWQYLLIFFVVSFCSTMIFSGFLIAVESILFLLQSVSNLGGILSNILQNLCVYPFTIFNFFLKLITLTFIPAFFMAHLPQKILVHPEFMNLGKLLIAALFWWLLGVKIFRLALKKYESGSYPN